MTFILSRLDLRKTCSDSKLDSNLGKKFGMQGLSFYFVRGMKFILNRHLSFYLVHLRTAKEVWIQIFDRREPLDLIDNWFLRNTQRNRKFWKLFLWFEIFVRSNSHETFCTQYCDKKDKNIWVLISWSVE